VAQSIVATASKQAKAQTKIYRQNMAAYCRIVDVVFLIFVGITCCQVSQFVYKVK
jgi:hypothetical protein